MRSTEKNQILQVLRHEDGLVVFCPFTPHDKASLTCSTSFLYLWVACWMRSRTVHPSLHGTTTPVLPKLTVTFIFNPERGQSVQMCPAAAGVCACVTSARLDTAFLHQTLHHQRRHDTIQGKVKQMKSDVY